MDKIMVIDDSPVQAEFLSSILKDDYEVSVFHTTQEGLEAAKAGGYSLILLDVVMPGMDGFTLLKELKGTELTKHIPVILLTSLSDVQYEERGLLLGAVDYVTKPFSPVIIKARVNTHIQLYQYQMQFKEQAMVDGMTGIANRRRYEGESQIKWQEAVRFGLPFSICMMDIDKFKVYNDTFGHPAGDQVIASVAKTASSHFRRATSSPGTAGRSLWRFLWATTAGPPLSSCGRSARRWRTSTSPTTPRWASGSPSASGASPWCPRWGRAMRLI